ncbi:hypothetical protein DEU56DRAFT_798069 [Suillus clintonianus]|uniref:uncharacterized protein n=1 Tax=Suillus clintonianus TaxID=1904413 RepID=UPI001B8744D2|nr:uncharacterized protein DEU56DRAFT_798069 [Suillus clintonianus]KAG2140664.1 hypothetical protein DEU56DRAFT_798069 [Suillus clintonianus]
MPHSQVNFIQNLFKDFDLGKVFAVRSRHPAKNGCTERGSTATHDECDNTIPAHIHSDFLFASPTLPSDSSSAYHVSATSEPRFEVSTNASSATSFGGVPPAREALNIALLVLPLVQGVAAAIPFAGPPMQTAINGLLTILQAIDRRIQNKADLNRLTERLHRLSCHLWNAPTARDPFEQRRRDSIVRILQETSAQLTNLYKHGLAYISVAQAIAGCSIEIDRYLLECLVCFLLSKVFLHSLTTPPG